MNTFKAQNVFLVWDSGHTMNKLTYECKQIQLKDNGKQCQIHTIENVGKHIALLRFAVGGLPLAAHL